MDTLHLMAKSEPISRMRTLRVALGLRQQDLAKKSGVAQSTVSRIEKGETVDVSAEIQQRFAEVLQTTVVDLFGEAAVVPARARATATAKSGGARVAEPVTEYLPTRPEPGEDETALEFALLEALDKSRHTLADVEEARAFIRGTDRKLREGADLLRMASEYLDVIAQMRRDDVARTAANILNRLTLGRRPMAHQLATAEERVAALNHEAAERRAAQGLTEDDRISPQEHAALFAPKGRKKPER